MARPRFLALTASLAAAFAVLATPAAARSDELQATFDSTFGTQVRQPQSFEAIYASSFEQRIAELANPAGGRIGVAAIDLATGEEVMVLGDQLFPLASTSKIAVAATYLEMVEQGRYSLTSEFPLMMPVRSAKYSSAKAPVREGQYMPAIDLIEIMITRSSNPATDALLAAVGGPARVNDWVRRQGINDFSINRDIATLVRDDGQYNPATYIDQRDAATPRTMVRLLAGLYRGDFLSEPEPSGDPERDEPHGDRQAPHPGAHPIGSAGQPQDRFAQQHIQRCRHYRDARWPCDCDCDLCDRPRHQARPRGTHRRDCARAV